METLGYCLIVLLAKEGLDIHLYMELDIAVIWIRVCQNVAKPTILGEVYREQHFLLQ